MKRLPPSRPRSAVILAAALGAAALGLAPAALAWEVAVTVGAPAFLAKEPVPCTITWRNDTPQAAPLALRKPFRILVSHNGQPAVERLLFLTAVEAVGEFAPPTTLVPPGGSASAPPFWLLLGSGTDATTQEFLFQTPGAYRISFPELGPGEAAFTVNPAQNAADLAAAADFPVDTAGAFLGETSRIPPVRERLISNLKRLRQDHAASFLAPYAAFALAEVEWTRPTSRFEVDFAAYESYIRSILDRANAPAFLRQRAWFGLARALAYSAPRKPAGLAVARDFAQAFPGSPEVGTLEAIYGQKLDLPFQGSRPPLVPRASSDTPPQVLLEGLEQVPDGARQAFAAFWNAVAAGNTEAASPLLADDYRGSDGTRTARLKRISAIQDRVRLDTVTVRILGAQARTEFALRRTAKASAGLWSGDLVAVDHEVRFTYLRRSDGKPGSDASAQPLHTVLLRQDGVWRIVAEDAGETANERVATLVPDLFNRLRADFRTAIPLRDGAPGTLDARLLASLSPEPGTSVARGEIQTVTITGPARDQAIFAGRFWTARDGTTSETPLRFEALLGLNAAHDGLELVDVEVIPAP